MPQVQNSRSNLWNSPFSYTYERVGTVNPFPKQDWALRPYYWGISQNQVVNSFRTGGWKTDSGKSTAYESLTGEQLRSEVILEGRKGLESTDNGHEFWLTKQSIKLATPIHATKTLQGNPTAQWAWDGPVLPSSVPTVLYAPIPALSTGNYRNLLGNRAFQELAPEESPVKLLISLAEIYREGLPSYVSLRDTYQSAWLNKAGSTHLETQFAVKPLANDIGRLAALAASANAVLTQYHRDAGRSIRRKAVLDETSETTSGETAPQDLLFGQIKTGIGAPRELIESAHRTNTLRYVDRTYRRTWFSGAFAYYLDDFGLSVVKKAADAETLLGLHITPELFWELTPWSWLFDWFGNLGNLIGALSRTYRDSLILRYGYLMVHQRVTRELSFKTELLSADLKPLPYLCITLSERKERVRAQPYGFGVDLSGLTNLQWSILAALGMTRASRTLW
jgi:hypothetical protein